MNTLDPTFKEQLAASGFAPFRDLAEALENTAPSVAVRLNPRKPGAAVPAGSRPVAWHPAAYHLADRPEFTLDPAMHQGAYYVQDASSMFVAEIVRQLLPDLPRHPRVLDLCAAPGGKSTAIADCLADGSLLVSNEYDFRRAEILKENIIKWGYAWSVVCRGDTSRFRKLPDFFDLVVVDAPCSGEGMMRKDAKAREQWSPALVRQCAALQSEILDNAAATLRPGGFLVYSTCTFNTRENELQTARLVAEGFEPVAIRLPEGSPIVSALPSVGSDNENLFTIPAGSGATMPSLRFLPGLVEGEGYTVAVLRKPAGAATPCRPPKKSKGAKTKVGAGAAKLPEKELLKCVDAALDPRFETLKSGEIAAIPGAIHADYLDLAAHLDIAHAGIAVAEPKGRDLVPTQSLAMAATTAANRGGGFPYPAVEVDTATALDYLRRQAITLAADAPRGYALLLHRPSPEAAPLPLGFVKNLGNRANNLYPAPWRILHL